MSSTRRLKTLKNETFIRVDGGATTKQEIVDQGERKKTCNSNQGESKTGRRTKVSTRSRRWERSVEIAGLETEKMLY